MTKTRVFARGDNVVARKVRDSLILVPLGNGNARLDCIYTLNETGSLIWDRASQGLSEDAIVSYIMNEYGIDENAAREDAAQLLNTLVDIGALLVVEAAMACGGTGSVPSGFAADTEVGPPESV